MPKLLQETLIAGDKGHPIVAFHGDGTFWIAPDVSPRLAARAFWDTMGNRREFKWYDVTGENVFVDVRQNAAVVFDEHTAGNVEQTFWTEVARLHPINRPPR